MYQEILNVSVNLFLFSLATVIKSTLLWVRFHRTEKSRILEERALQRNQTLFVQDAELI